ncbi:hypothetical protein [Anaerococcus octavius]|uniref:hypothetical protein n=1 Tax=Anaerococcus octavius TaxID=54007 RepID=UPI0027BAE3E3|nr:hypothetical protein [Anaerococcus octavius]
MEKYKKYFGYILALMAIIALLFGDRYLDKEHNLLLSIVSIIVLIFINNTNKRFARTNRIINTIAFILILMSKIRLYFAM